MRALSTTERCHLGDELVGPASRNQVQPDAGAGCLVQDRKVERSGRVRICDEALPGGRQAVHSHGFVIREGE
jgi:hypothetical protein